MARVFDDPDAEPVAEADPYKAFGEPVELVTGVQFSPKSAEGASITSSDMDGDGDIDIFIANAEPTGSDIVERCSHQRRRHISGR